MADTVELAVHGKITVIGDLRTNINVEVRMGWTSDDPAAVTFSFRDDDQEELAAPWTVGRDLVMSGTLSTFMTGNGDASFRRSGQRFVICLSSPDGHSHVEIPLSGVRDFLGDTVVKVPLGQENVGAQVDAFLADVFRYDQPEGEAA
jgi:hypothetical protein